jgi:[acyl-carrier-protein] S-malonyltransferase
MTVAKFAVVFPGQNSQSLKMEDDLQHIDIIKKTFNIAHEVLGVDYLQMLQEDSPDNINDTIHTQPLMLTAGYAAYQLLLDKLDRDNHKIIPTIMAGHSLGEWTALVASQAIKFEDALRLVKLRAEAMQDAVPVGIGAMAAVLGMDDEMVIAICEQVSLDTNQVVAAVNFNSVGQVIIAGNTKAVELAMQTLKDRGARKVQLLSVSVPSHCSLMLPAAEKLKAALADITMELPQIPVLHNIDGKSVDNVAAIKDALVRQLYSPVQWTTTINNIVNQGVTHIVECGPGRVLSGLNKRINPEITSYNLNKETDFELEF